MKPCWVFLSKRRSRGPSPCDGYANGFRVRGHDGMNYILASREAIANMVEIHASVVPYDAGILISKLR